MVLFICILLVTIFLAYVNGANDNFKGVATLFGSGTTDYKRALLWACAATFLGSLSALFISQKIISTFSGGGFIPAQVANEPYFLICVGLGAASTVLVATLTGIPISTTHSLAGALLGAGLVSAGGEVNFSSLGSKIFLPLIFSPAIAVVLTFIIYPIFKFIRLNLGIEHQMCLCVGERIEPVSISKNGALVLKSSGLSLTVDEARQCEQHYLGKILSFDAQRVMDRLHYLSAGAMSFARGLNDTPKIVALLLVMNVFSLKWGIFTVAIGMAIGGLLNARRVAFTMSKRITKMNHGQGFTANLVSAILVIFASGWGLPVSTTHVSCGSLFGIGLVSRKANISVIRQIISAWVLTLPLAGILSIASFLVINHIK